jgi:hypothetical protein
MLQPKRRAICRLAKIFILRNVLLCCLANLFIVLRIQHPRILVSHWLWAVYTRSCSILFSEISPTWHGTCLLLYDNLCLEVHYHPLFSTFSLVIFPLFNFLFSSLRVGCCWFNFPILILWSQWLHLSYFIIFVFWFFFSLFHVWKYFLCSC